MKDGGRKRGGKKAPSEGTRRARKSPLVHASAVSQDVSSAQPSFDCPGSAANDLASDLNQITDDNGQVRFRQHSAVNKYNPQGITLLSVQLGLDPYNLSDLTATVNADLTQAPEQDNQTFDDYLAGEALIGESDEKLVQLIKCNPALILADARVAYAVSRWTYGAWFSRSQSARKHGRQMLAQVRPRKSGRKERALFTPESLAAAYDDLYDYGDGLRQCAVDAHTASDITNHFPDCRPLFQIGIPTVESLKRNTYKLPTGNTVAIRFLEYVTGLKEKRILGVTQGLRRTRVAAANPAKT